MMADTAACNAVAAFGLVWFGLVWFGGLFFERESRAPTKGSKRACLAEDALAHNASLGLGVCGFRDLLWVLRGQCFIFVTLFSGVQVRTNTVVKYTNIS
jgi:hypothetical protein